MVKITNIEEDLNKLTKAERRALYKFYTGANVYMSEREMRNGLGYKSNIYDLLGKLVDKEFLSIWANAGAKGVNLYHLSDRIRRSQNNLSKMYEVIRPKYWCKSCKRVHYRDSDIGERHIKYKDKGKGDIIWLE